MDSTSLPQPVLITRPEALNQLVDQLANEPILAVDTESNSLYAYREQVCLIQFSTPQDDFLVDPLVLEDLSPLEAIFADNKIEKIFHAAEYDLISMKRDYGFKFENLFDTMIAARILGWEKIGLGSILQSEFDVQLNKRYQRANWGKRPIPPEMVNYARLDTHYLIPLRYRLKNELLSRERWPVAEEDFMRLRHVNGRDPDDQPEPCWRVRGAYDLDAKQAAVLLELCVYRMGVAESMNRPVFKVISDQSLLAIAEDCPVTPQELRNLSALSPKQYKRHKSGIVKAVQEGLKADPVFPPRNPKPDDAFLARLENLRSWRKETGKQNDVKSDVVLPRDVMYAIANRNPDTLERLGEVMDQVPWRFEQYGDEILDVLKES
jgi:ribonuclease D